MENENLKISLGKRLINTQSIVRLQGMSNYSKIYFINEKPLVFAKTLYWFENRLPKHLFFRVHKSHLVNKFFIKEINGPIDEILSLSNGENIVMSRRKKEQQMLKLFGNFK